jgi:hypothetical protein
VVQTEVVNVEQMISALRSYGYGIIVPRFACRRCPHRFHKDEELVKHMEAHGKNDRCKRCWRYLHESEALGSPCSPPWCGIYGGF